MGLVILDRETKEQANGSAAKADLEAGQMVNSFGFASSIW